MRRLRCCQKLTIDQCPCLPLLEPWKLTCGDTYGGLREIGFHDFKIIWREPWLRQHVQIWNGLPWCGLLSLSTFFDFYKNILFHFWKKIKNVVYGYMPLIFPRKALVVVEISKNKIFSESGLHNCEPLQIRKGYLNEGYLQQLVELEILTHGTNHRCRHMYITDAHNGSSKLVKPISSAPWQHPCLRIFRNLV